MASAARRCSVQVEEGFPFLPSGSQIVLDAVARDLVLENVKQQVAPRWAALVSEVRAHPDNQLASYLDASGRGLEDVLKSNRSWTSLCRDAGKLGADTGPREADLVKRVRAFAHLRPSSVDGLPSILEGKVGMEGPIERRLAEMLFYSLNPNGGGFDGLQSGLDAIRGEAVVDELRQVIDIAFDNAPRSTYELGSLAARARPGTA